METHGDLREVQDVVHRKGGPEPDAGREAVEAVAGKPPEPGERPAKPDVTDEQEADATHWLLSSFDGDEEPAVQHLIINVGSRERPRKVPWTVSAIPREAVMKIRTQAEGNRQARRDPGFLGTDPETVYKGNLRIIIEGTLDPDIKAVARERGVPPEVFLRQAIDRKGGLADYIAGEILTLSGFDPDSLEDAEAKDVPTLARAAGN